MVLATLPDGRPQALRFGPAAWGVQFHPETSPEIFGAWLRWDSPDGLTPEQEELLASVTAAREGLRAAWRPLAERFAALVEAAAATSGATRADGVTAAGRACGIRHHLSPLCRSGVASAAAGPAPAVDPAVTENAMSAPTSAEPRERVLILGAAGRDFHDFNVLYRDDPGVEVVAFTATQIPDIDGRTYPPALAGPLYPDGIRIVPEADLEALVAARARRHRRARLLRPRAHAGHAPRLPSGGRRRRLRRAGARAARRCARAGRSSP